jgi:hypothetical protein
MHVSRFAWVGILLAALGVPAASAQDREGDDENNAAPLAEGNSTAEDERDTAASGHGDAGSLDSAPERCIALNRVDHTDVIDDRTLIFHMRNGAMYLNHLDRECPGLKREERFMYSPTSNRLCNVDTVTVLEDWGFGLTRGFTCTLGNFHPISEADLAELKRGIGERESRDGDIEIERVDPDELEKLLEDEDED